MKKRIPGILCALPGLLLAIGVRTFFSPCVHDDGSLSTCAACGSWVFRAGIALAVLAVVRAFLPKKGKPAADTLLILLSACSFLLPVLLKTCMLQSMRCNALMKPAVWLISAVSVLLFVITLVKDLCAGKEKQRS